MSEQQDNMSEITFNLNQTRQNQRQSQQIQRQNQRITNLLMENEKSRYKVFVTDADNNIVWNVEDVSYRMFAKTMQKVQEFLEQLFIKYGPNYNFYIYDTYNIYVNRTNSQYIRHPSFKTTVVYQNQTINQLLNSNKLPGKVYKAQINFNINELIPGDEISYSELSFFIPSSNDMGQYLGKGRHLQKYQFGDNQK